MPALPRPQVTGLESSLMALVKMVRDYIERGDGAIARLVSSLAQTPAGEWIVSGRIPGPSPPADGEGRGQADTGHLGSRCHVAMARSRA